jgi:hypothetical protein
VNCPSIDYQPGLKAILDNSVTLVNWALAALGGSVAALIGTSYERPKTLNARMIYWLFPLGWFFLVWSIYQGQQISGRFIAAQIAAAKHDAANQETVRTILIATNSDFDSQQFTLTAGLVTLSLWLLCFLVWFICNPESEKKDSSTTAADAGDPKI